MHISRPFSYVTVTREYFRQKRHFDHRAFAVQCALHWLLFCSRRATVLFAVWCASCKRCNELYVDWLPERCYSSGITEVSFSRARHFESNGHRINDVAMSIAGCYSSASRQKTKEHERFLEFSLRTLAKHRINISTRNVS